MISPYLHFDAATKGSAVFRCCILVHLAQAGAQIARNIVDSRQLDLFSSLICE